MHAEVCPNFWPIVYIVQHQLEEGNWLNVANMLCIALTLVFSYCYWDFNHNFLFVWKKSKQYELKQFLCARVLTWTSLTLLAGTSKQTPCDNNKGKTISVREKSLGFWVTVNKTFECCLSFFELLCTIFQSHTFFLNCNCNVFLSLNISEQLINAQLIGNIGFCSS